jgi:hypothetical protein
MLFDMTATSQVVLKRLAEGARSALAHLKPGDEVAVENPWSLLTGAETHVRAPVPCCLQPGVPE